MKELFVRLLTKFEKQKCYMKGWGLANSSLDQRGESKLAVFPKLQDRSYICNTIYPSINQTSERALRMREWQKSMLQSPVGNSLWFLYSRRDGKTQLNGYSRITMAEEYSLSLPSSVCQRRRACRSQATVEVIAGMVNIHDARKWSTKAKKEGPTRSTTCTTSTFVEDHQRSKRYRTMPSTEWNEIRVRTRSAGPHKTALTRVVWYQHSKSRFQSSYST
jgi:hypothetical protein